MIWSCGYDAAGGLVLSIVMGHVMRVSAMLGN